jgi:hypothetical protein
MISCTGNKEDKPLAYYGRFKSIPANAITPKGWLKQYLLNQRNGLTGHLENAGYPFNTQGWAADSITGNKSIEKWWPYEQNGYWVDGMIRCGLLLNDTFLLNKARKSIYYVLNHPDRNGFLGPKYYELDKWVYVVFFRAWMAEYEATKNPGILNALKKHFLNNRFPYTNIRESINIENMLWVYYELKDTALLNYAREIYKKSNEMFKNSQVSDISFLKDSTAGGEHGVTYLEKSKLGAILYLYTGDSTYLKPSIAAFRKLDKYNMLIDGVNVSSEHIQTPTTQESHEICDISDYTWNISYLLKATGDASYADKIERAAFNAAPGSVTKDFKALQYFSAPNQVIAARNSNIRDGGGTMRYAPNPGTECCPGNVNRMMPNFAINSWMTDGKDGLVAAMYAPSSVKVPVGKHKNIIIVDEDTYYPFSDTINFTFHMKDKNSFSFYVRIPGWCKKANILVNGIALNQTITPSSYININRKYKEGDNVTVILPSDFTITDGPENGKSVERGPLIYSLKIKEDWKTDIHDERSTHDFPAWELFPESPWNYALCINRENLQQQIKVVYKPYSLNPWSIENAPVELKVPARIVNGWDLEKKTEMKFEHWTVERDARGKVIRWYIDNSTMKKGSWLFSPLLPDAGMLKKGLSNITDTVTLIPYGCSKLRITVFPVTGNF